MGLTGALSYESPYDLKKADVVTQPMVSCTPRSRPPTSSTCDLGAIKALTWPLRTTTNSHAKANNKIPRGIAVFVVSQSSKMISVCVRFFAWRVSHNSWCREWAEACCSMVVRSTAAPMAPATTASRARHYRQPRFFRLRFMIAKPLTHVHAIVITAWKVVIEWTRIKPRIQQQRDCKKA